MMNFVAFDFETANHERHSAMSLALVVVRNSQIVDRFYSLIRTPTPVSSRNTAVHGLTASDVADAPTFAEIWPIIMPFFQPDQLAVAHNAGFDTSVLAATLAYYKIDCPAYLVLDTLRTSRRLWPQLVNHKLNTLAAHINVRLEHHNALSDAEATAKIVLAQEQAGHEAVLRGLVKQK